MRAVRTHLSLSCLRKAPQISLLGGLFYFRCHLPCGKYAAFAVCIPKKSSNVSLNMLRALMHPTA